MRLWASRIEKVFWLEIHECIQHYCMNTGSTKNNAQFVHCINIQKMFSPTYFGCLDITSVKDIHSSMEYIVSARISRVSLVVWYLEAKIFLAISISSKIFAKT